MSVPIPKSNPARIGAIAAGGAIVAAVALYWFAQRPTPERVAQAWTSANRGVAEDNLNALIQSRAAGFDLEIGEGVGVDWAHSPPMPAGGDNYEIAATASVRLEIPVVGMTHSDGVVSAYTIETALPFHLTVDMGARTVADWHVHLDEGEFVSDLPTATSAEVPFRDAAANDCVNAALDAGLQDYAMRTLLKPASERPRRNRTAERRANVQRRFGRLPAAS